MHRGTVGEALGRRPGSSPLRGGVRHDRAPERRADAPYTTTHDGTSEMLKGLGRVPFPAKPKSGEAGGTSAPYQPAVTHGHPPAAPVASSPAPPPAPLRPTGPATEGARPGPGEVRAAQAPHPLPAGRPTRHESDQRDRSEDAARRDPGGRRAALRHGEPAAQPQRAPAAGQRDPRRDLRLRPARAPAQGR